MRPFFHRLALSLVTGVIFVYWSELAFWARPYSGTSLAEIEKLISELESLRDLLHAEGQRVQREISGYAQLSQAAMKSTRSGANQKEEAGHLIGGYPTLLRAMAQRIEAHRQARPATWQTLEEPLDLPAALRGGFFQAA